MIFAIIVFLLQMLVILPLGDAQATDADLAASYRFLVSDRDSADGVLYTATAGKLRGRLLPLSFSDSPEYWGRYVCELPGNSCSVTDVYDPQTYTLTPQKSHSGDLQTERVNSHNGTNIYDAATWQIAVMLGHAINRFSLPDNEDPYALVSNQNYLLKEGYNGNSSTVSAGQNRAMTSGKVFVYNQRAITEPQQAYAFRMLPRNWLSVDPFAGTRYADRIKTAALPQKNPEYQPGRVTWTDWKPITGENGWAFLVGPLQAAYIHYILDQKSAFVPLQDPAVQNALDILPTFAAMQSPSGALYYAPAGTVANQGEQLVDPYGVSVENNFSLYAGLTLLHSTLWATITHEPNVRPEDAVAIQEALQLVDAMINGGMIGKDRTTSGLLAFFRDLAWRDGEFVQGGRADDPTSTVKWVPSLQPKAVDVNTWGIAALGPQQIDAWFGFGAAYQNWQQVKKWGGYGVGRTLWGVGFSNQDGNGIDADGNFRQGILSTEWTAGAINMLRTMISYYEKIPKESNHYRESRRFLATLGHDMQSMVAAIDTMRLDTYATSSFPGRPQEFAQLFTARKTRPYLYASKRYLIPFGWYANPMPSTCATAWVIMVHAGYNPFAYGGK
ncbi:hypothetical protein FCL47_13185 [Desulfopila sp. IMCC35006]|uniref:hypothetical protein n=1 Tax=Desulfopila sp. IMCC35006 TaxID=2569542 RepID=UPI0010AB8CD5|nr:hypothetical protein [Desulfopila sp. IMCC35006]TKB25491.1 hypothetical protein FCL47_13185 [Desulfopila sp. IMCC35006]